MEIERKTVDMPDPQRQTELGVTRQYAQTHGWVVHALAGWLSAYYMEDPGFAYCDDFMTWRPVTKSGSANTKETFLRNV